MANPPKYYIADSRSLRQELKRHKVQPFDLIITSPPYFDLINYDGEQRQIGYGEKDYESFVSNIATIFHECYLHSAENATFWLVVDTFKKKGTTQLFPFDIVNSIKKKYSESWRLKDIIVWDKGKNLPWNQKGNFKNQHEYILFFTKGSKYVFDIDPLREILELKKWWKTYPERYNPDGKAPHNIWQINTPIRGWGDKTQDHFCPFPYELVERIISISSKPGQHVFDPFAGSGSVLAVAHAMGRDASGFDVNKNYKKRYVATELEAAKRYWERRIRETDELSKYAANFKQTNLQLRKLKVADHVLSRLSRHSEHLGFVYLKNQTSNSALLYIPIEQFPVHLDLSEETLGDLLKKSKVKLILKYLPVNEIQKLVNNRKHYRYNLGKFFSFNNSSSSFDFEKYKLTVPIVVSDIDVKIP